MILGSALGCSTDSRYIFSTSRMQSPVMGIPDLWRLLHDIDFAPDCVLKVAHIVDLDHHKRIVY